MTATMAQRKSADARKRLLDAALDVISRKGYTAASMNEIVQQAGVSKGLAYYHFKGKADIAQSVLESGVDKLVEDFDTIAENCTDALDGLMKLLDSFATTIFDNRSFGRLLATEIWREGRAWSDTMRSYEERMVHIVSGLIRRGQEEGTLRKRLEPEFSTAALLGMVLASAMSLINIDDAAVPVSAEERARLKQVFVANVRDFGVHAMGTAKAQQIYREACRDADTIGPRA
jgi:AcrR family transcriptional regulator